MGMIRRADLEDVVRDASVMNLDDLRSRGEAIIAEARLHAERVVAEANAERERLLANAHEEGHALGHAKGLEEGRAQGEQAGREAALAGESEAIESLKQALEVMRTKYEDEREQMLRDARTDLVRLAADIASRVTKRSVDLDPKAVVAQLETVLDAVVRPTRLVIRVNTDDLDAAERAMPGLLERYEQCRHAELVADAALARGSAVATTEDGGRIDASIDAQLERIVAELLPEQALLEDRLGERDSQRDDQRNDAA